MVHTATTAKSATRHELTTLRLVIKGLLLLLVRVVPALFANTTAFMVRQAISKAGKFCKGNVKMTAIEYANCTDVAKFPAGKEVVRTVLTSGPKAIQQVSPKKQ